MHISNTYVENIKFILNSTKLKKKELKKLHAFTLRFNCDLIAKKISLPFLNSTKIIYSLSNQFKTMNIDI